MFFQHFNCFAYFVVWEEATIVSKLKENEKGKRERARESERERERARESEREIQRDRKREIESIVTDRNNHNGSNKPFNKLYSTTFCNFA
jgi:hypothetical protein